MNTFTSKKQAISVTHQAAEQIKLLLAKRERPALGIRVGIKMGGCSGQAYYLEYADEKKQFDEVIECAGVIILVDAKALMYLLGTEMDYQATQFKSGFTFTNPNVKGECGCGKSFSI